MTVYLVRLNGNWTLLGLIPIEGDAVPMTPPGALDIDEGVASLRGQGHAG
jgi:hypothetical protein